MLEQATVSVYACYTTTPLPTIVSCKIALLLSIVADF